MSTLTMTKRKKEGRYELRYDETWMEVVKVAADQLGVSVADYIRMGVNEKLRRDGFTPPTSARPAGGTTEADS